MAEGAPPGKPDRTVLVAIIGAGALVVSAAIGALGARTGALDPVLPGSNPTTTVTVTMPPKTVTIEAGNPSDPGGGGGAAQPEGVYHEGALELTWGQEADLDAPPTDRQWGIAKPVYGPEQEDVRWAVRGLSFPTPALGVGVKYVDDSTCQSATGYAHDGIDRLDLKVGTYICVMTSEQRYSLLRVTKLTPDENRIALHVKTYNKEGD
jgi:hypothetical protein